MHRYEVTRVYSHTDPEPKMLPAHAVFQFPWEVLSGDVKDGDSVRTFGRLITYQPEESKATLSAQHAATPHQVVIQTTFVEPFEPIIGAQYIVLGEIENVDEGGVVIRARVLNCVDGVNLALLQRAINVQRTYFRERALSEGDDVAAHPLAPP
ncbi:hypothetical protein DPEC_G00175790 [Dallia pectoralis]|uniref:Uncharacterized protein n=1 Tax=Dallia pectoralis TaxID=75939 RepID=A0ACC2GEM9_DALPE|nr:hypothetical protein DPEC_G00175790 [Dallia pectoralis]